MPRESRGSCAGWTYAGAGAPLPRCSLPSCRCRPDRGHPSVAQRSVGLGTSHPCTAHAQCVYALTVDSGS